MIATGNGRAAPRTSGLLLLVCLNYLLAFAVRVSVVPFYGRFMTSWGASYAAIGALMSAFLLAYAASQVPAGFLADRVNNFRMLALGSLLLAGGGAAFAFAPDLPTALAYRALMGVGAAVSYTSGFRLLANAFPGARRAFALGTMEAAGGVGMLLSLTVLPLLAERLAPGTLFLALSLALAPLGALTLHAPGHKPAACRSGPAGRREVYSHLVLVLLIGFLGMIAIYGILTWTPTFLSQALGASTGQQALVMAFLVGGFTLGAPAAGRLSDRLGNRTAVLGSASLAMGVLLLAQAALPRLGWQVPLASLLGLAMGFSMAPLLALSAEVLGPQAAGSAAGMTVASAQLGSALSGCGLGWIIDRTGNFAWVWGICALCLVARAALAAAIRPLRHVRHRDRYGRPYRG